MELTLTKLPWYAQIGAFVALAVGGLRRFLLLLRACRRAPTWRRGSRSCVALHADITKGLTTAKKLPEFRQQVADLEARLANLKAMLPEEKDAADLLSRMQTVAAQSNMTIKEFKPSPTVTKQLHAEWPITLELEGTYHNLAIFFDRVGKFTRIVNISGLDVKGKRQAEPNATITATCVATTFVLLDKPDAGPSRRGEAGGGADEGKLTSRRIALRRVRRCLTACSRRAPAPAHGRAADADGRAAGSRDAPAAPRRGAAAPSSAYTYRPTAAAIRS